MRVVDQKRSELQEALLSMRRIFVVAGVFSFFINGLMLVPAIYMLQVYDRVLNSRNEMTLLMITLITVGLFALLGALEWVRSQLLVRASVRLDERLNDRVFAATFDAHLARGRRQPCPGLVRCHQPAAVPDRQRAVRFLRCPVGADLPDRDCNAASRGWDCFRWSAASCSSAWPG